MPAKAQSNNQEQISNFYRQLPETIICLSHLRWDFVFQRPQHLFTRLAKQFKIYFIEEPVFDNNGDAAYIEMQRGSNIHVLVPHLPANLEPQMVTKQLKALFDAFMTEQTASKCTFWYYTPMALEFTRKHQPELTVYDCMDELSAFKFAPTALRDLEKELLNWADVVFTGGQSLYEAKKTQHSNIHPFPSSIDKAHFSKARAIKSLHKEKNDKPLHLGFFGVIDERFDIELIRGIAEARPEWTISLIGPVVKVDPAHLPDNTNIKYLGQQSYSDLPEHLAQWDFALIPFLLNDSTKFISPTKTPEYLAAGVPVISTPIRDVVNPYGKRKLVSIAGTADEFVAAIEQQLQVTDKGVWLQQVDNYLSQLSWDLTCNRMLNLMKETVLMRAVSPIAQ